MAQPQEQPSMPLVVDVRDGTTLGPDGRVWPKVAVRVGLVETTIVLPPEAAGEVGDNIGAAFRRAAANARRAASGLIVPDMILPRPPSNGTRP